MIQESRDANFWSGVLHDPAVAPRVEMGQSIDMAAVLADPSVTPFRSEHGGFLFFQRDPLGWVQEVHALFTPEGWGREALLCALGAFDEMFRRGARLIITQEVESNWRSRPPKTFRFRQASDFVAVPALGANLRLWTLAHTDWVSAPARKRMV